MNKVKFNSELRLPSNGDLSTCDVSSSDSVEVDNNVKVSTAIGVPPNDDLGVELESVKVEPRTLLSCIDPVGIIVALSKFDWSRIVWRSVLVQVVLHSLGGLGWKLILNGEVMYQTVLFSLAVHVIAAVGITAGYHRRWSHRTYKSHKSVDVLLMLMGTLATQNSIYDWARDHRVHHKYSETKADPHNADAGLFFAHMGWLMVRKHEDVKEKGKTCSMKDLEKDQLVMWQHRNYLWFTFVLAVILPTILPAFLFGENLIKAYFVAFSRILLTLHATWCVNSLAHWWGDHPYDARIFPVENAMVAMITVGEGWHNYHHTFQHDYRASNRIDPFYLKIFLNPTSIFIDTLAAVGLVWNRNKTPSKIVQEHSAKYGRTCLKSKQQ